MVNINDREVERLHRVLAPLYEEGGFQKSAIKELWSRIEAAQAAAVREDVLNND
jgi:hypothetical protein